MDDSSVMVLKRGTHCASDSDSDHETLTHEELLEISSTTLNDMIKRDPLLADLPKGITVEEVNSQIALEHGQSITVYIAREDGEKIPAVVHQQGATVLDLKRAIRRYMSLKLARERRFIKLSWQYVWRSNWLWFDGHKLKDNNALLSDYGIRNKSRLTFVKRLREKGRTLKRGHDECTDKHTTRPLKDSGPCWSAGM